MSPLADIDLDYALTKPVSPKIAYKPDRKSKVQHKKTKIIEVSSSDDDDDDDDFIDTKKKNLPKKSQPKKKSVETQLVPFTPKRKSGEVENRLTLDRLVVVVVE